MIGFTLLILKFLFPFLCGQKCHGTSLKVLGAPWAPLCRLRGCLRLGSRRAAQGRGLTAPALRSAQVCVGTWAPAQLVRKWFSLFKSFVLMCKSRAEG